MKKIRTSFTYKVITVYLALNLIFPIAGLQTGIYQSFALTGGPSQPEFNSFTPIGTSDMVSLSSGDFNYNIPIMDVGGYPLNLAYDSGVTMDQEASWVGLGWNLNVGQINRNVRGLPDDFNGDKMTYKNNMKPNTTIGTYFGLGASAFGLGEIGVKANLGLGVQYNNYNGISFKPSLGISFELSDAVSVGVSLSSSVAEGANVSPSISLSKKSSVAGADKITNTLGASINSRQGLTSLSLSSSISKSFKYTDKKGKEQSYTASRGKGASISMNDQLLFTPTKRTEMRHGNFTFNAALGPTAFGISGQGKISGYGSSQWMASSEKNKKVHAYGYEHTEQNEKGSAFHEGKNKGVLDFNREKDKTFSKNTTILPITNYTYDRYAINGQGIGGSFRPYRSQVGFVQDPYIHDFGGGGNFGFEAEFGWNFAAGIDLKISTSNSHTGLWKFGNHALSKFTDVSENAPIEYEKVYFRTEGELNVDAEGNGTTGIFKNLLGETKPIRIDVSGGKHNRKLQSTFVRKGLSNIGIPSGIKRNARLIRNQSIQKITKKEASNDPFIEVNNHAKSHHTAGFKVLKSDGSTYVFGKTAYNTKKIEATFAVNGTGDCSTGLVSYGGNDNTSNNNQGVDHFFNSTETPAYAHTYLLSSILSTDYEDLTNNGVSDDDLGSYTKFTYANPYNYKWRVPFATNKASANDGFFSHPKDQKGHYIYGEREQIYINKIETKTHIAIFTLTDRADAKGVSGENGGSGTLSKKLDKIELFSKNDMSTPIKTAYFTYDYSQCPGVPNSTSGKLTLKKVQFSYQDSKMGMYNPYSFEYGQINGTSFNPSYNLKGYDIWGNYKENNGTCGVTNGAPSTAEFPYVEQNKTTADKNVTAWTLTTVNLPSGGKIEVQFESDDYQFVQNKKIMQLYDMYGAGETATPSQTNTLFNGSDDFKYLYVKIPDGAFNVDDYIQEIKQDPIYFKFLLQMSASSGTKYDFVTGYLNIDQNKPSSTTTIGGQKILSLPMKFLSMEGGWFNSNRKVNPISKAGWYFGRQNMNRIVYSLGGDYSTNTSVVAVVEDLIGSIGAIVEIFKGPNKALRDKDCAKRFKPKKSWVRLLNPTKRKLGGGSRVKKLQMHDNWDVMTFNTGNDVYKQFYGQVYSYDNEDNTTSGVATFEPNGSVENPFVMPFYDNGPDSKKDRLLAPKEMNFTEKPIGESFFPGPTVTYGRVTVKNLQRENITKHATGKVVNSFYTSYDFPTHTDYTEIEANYDAPSTLSKLLNFSVKTHLTLSQGFVIETNDMNGKQKSQWVYAEGQDAPLSGVEYKYSVNASNGRLNNLLPVINDEGKIEGNTLIGVNYDVNNDFRESKSVENTYGINGNLAGFLVFIFPALIPVPLPTYAHHENILHVSTTTKVVQKHGIMTEKIAYDLGARVSTENIAWDKLTGQVLVTKTINEYDDAYYSLNYPSHWYPGYKGMGAASHNLDLQGTLTSFGSGNTFTLNGANALTHLLPGDELATIDNNGNYLKLWIVDINNTGKVTLMNREGIVMNNPNGDHYNSFDFKIVRSGYRNLQMSSMASVTTMTNPVYTSGGAIRSSVPSFEPYNPITDKIINASAVEYSDFWKSQCERRLPYFKVDSTIYDEDNNQVSGVGFLNLINEKEINPYIYNIRGDWRAKRSYAYLTKRKATADPRTDGYFLTFKPFYKYASWASDWVIDRSQWTFASQVTQYSPYGTELENKDALDRYSSAQYGYNYTLPTAVASNSEYREIGFDGFEDYDATAIEAVKPHFGYQDDVIVNGSATVVETAHTGRRSLEVNSKSTATTTYRLIDCVTETSGGIKIKNNRTKQKVKYLKSRYIDDMCNKIDESISFNLLEEESFNLKGENLSFSIIKEPSFGTIKIDDNGTKTLKDDILIYTKTKEEKVDAFAYQICTSTGECKSGSFILLCKKEQEKSQQNN